MEYRTDWKQFLKYDEKGRRSHEFPVYLVDTAPNEKQYLYHDEYTALVAAEKAAKDARRAARQAELAAGRAEAEQQSAQAGSRPEASESRASVGGRRACPPWRGGPANPSDPVAILAGPPDFERHSRRCVVCSHPDRDAIEGEFIRWRSPHKIARDYDITDRTTIYRHAHATNLFEARRRQIGRVLESYLETIDDTPPADFDPVTRAVRVYAHLNANGAWIEPRRTVHILTSRVDTPWPNPEPEPDFDPDPNNAAPHPKFDATPLDDPQSDLPAATAAATADPVLRVEAPEFTRGEQRFSAAEKNADPFTSRRHQPLTSGANPTAAMGYSEVPAGTAEGSPGRQSRERDTQMKSAAPAAHTFGANLSTALVAQAQKDAFHESPITNYQSQISEGEEKSNRNNPRIKNRRNRLHRKDITKVNRNKNTTSASPHFRPVKTRESRSARGRNSTKVNDLRTNSFRTTKTVVLPGLKSGASTQKIRCRMAVPRVRARAEVGGCCGNW